MDRERDRRSRPGSALKRRTRLRPPRSLRATRAGWCFIAIIFGVGFAALNTGNNLLYLVLAMMLAFLVLSGLLSESSLRGIRIERRLPRELYARADNRVVLRIRNNLRRVASFALSVEDLLETADGPDSAGRCFALRVEPRGASDQSYAFRPDHRGDVHFDRVRVSTRFPFGLFIKSVELELPESALVYPGLQRVGTRHDVIGADDASHSIEGAAKRGDDIAGLREFEPGDSVARVHWRRSQRVGRLVVGEREGEASGEIEVLLSLDGDASHSVHESRISLAASEAVTHLERGLRVGLSAPNLRIPPSSGPAHRREILTVLARLDPTALLRSAGNEKRPEATSGSEARR